MNILASKAISMPREYVLVRTFEEHLVCAYEGCVQYGVAVVQPATVFQLAQKHGIVVACTWSVFLKNKQEEEERMK